MCMWALVSDRWKEYQEAQSDRRNTHSLVQRITYCGIIAGGQGTQACEAVRPAYGVDSLLAVE